MTAGRFVHFQNSTREERVVALSPGRTFYCLGFDCLLVVSRMRCRCPIIHVASCIEGSPFSIFKTFPVLVSPHCCDVRWYNHFTYLAVRHCTCSRVLRDVRWYS